MSLNKIVELMRSNVEALVFNRQLEANTWEPMILAEVDPPDRQMGTRWRIKLVPKRCSPAFPGDLTYYWTEEELLKHVRKVVEASVAETKELKSPATTLELPSTGTYQSSSITWKMSNQLTGDKPVWWQRWAELVASVRNGERSVDDLQAMLSALGAMPANQGTEAQRIDYVALSEAIKTLEVKE